MTAKFNSWLIVMCLMLAFGLVALAQAPPVVRPGAPPVFSPGAPGQFRPVDVSGTIYLQIRPGQSVTIIAPSDRVSQRPGLSVGTTTIEIDTRVK